MAEVDVVVKVVLHPAEDPTLFHFDTIDLPMGPKNYLYFRNAKKGDHFRIFYELDNSARPGFLFPTGQGQAHLLNSLWVHNSTACPTQACTWNQFRAHDVEKQGQTLVVKNMNDEVADFAYSLRVTDGSEWLDLDPGGGNQDGGVRFVSYAAIVTGAIVGIGAITLAFHGFDPPAVLIYGIGGAVVGLIVGFVFDRL